MAFIVETDNDVMTSPGVHFTIPRDSNYSPFAVLAGPDSADIIRIAQFTSDGKLKVDASVTIDSVDIGDVDGRGKDSSGVSRYLQVVTDPVLSRYALVVNDPRMTFSAGALDVNVVAAAPVGGVNKFGTASALDGVWVTVASQVVLLGESFDVSGLTVWGDTDAEWSLLAGSTQKGGARTSASRLSESVSYSQPVTIPGPITVYIKAKHYSSGKTVDFYANLAGRLH